MEGTAVTNLIAPASEKKAVEKGFYLGLRSSRHLEERHTATRRLIASAFSILPEKCKQNKKKCIPIPNRMAKGPIRSSFSLLMFPNGAYLLFFFL